MGVHGLWQLIQCTGKPVSLHSLEGKILAIDVSIWLHHAVKGMRDKDGNPLPNAHLQVLFSRVCKLLFYRIKPVFVFDGGVPVLKKQTLISRREHRELAEKESAKTNQRLLQNLMKSQAVKEVLGENANSSSSRGQPSASTRPRDMFELAPLPAEFIRLQEEDQSLEELSGEKDVLAEEEFDEIDIDSADFHSLPSELKHEILTTMKQQRKYNTWAKIHDLPEDSVDFSSYQMEKILKQNKLGAKIDEVRKEMNAPSKIDLSHTFGDDYYSECVVQSQRVISEDTAHFVLIKGVSKQRRDEELAKAKEFEEEMIQAEIMSLQHGARTSGKNNERNGEVRGKNDCDYTVDEMVDIQQDIEGKIGTGMSGVSQSEKVKHFRDSNVKKMSENEHETECDSVAGMSGFSPTEKMETIKPTGKSGGKKILMEVEQDTDIVSRISGFEPSEKEVEQDTDIVSRISGFEPSEKEVDIRRTGINEKLSTVDDVYMNVTGNSTDILTNTTRVSAEKERGDILSELLKMKSKLLQKISTDDSNITESCDSSKPPSESGDIVIPDVEHSGNYVLPELANKEKTGEVIAIPSSSKEEGPVVVSSDEEGVVQKKLRLDDDFTGELGNQVPGQERPKTPVAVDSSSEDEGFIEISIDPTKTTEPDDLFPVSIFLGGPDAGKVTMDTVPPSPTSPPRPVVIPSSPPREVAMEEHAIAIPDDDEDDVMSSSDTVLKEPNSFQDFTEADLLEFQEDLEVESRSLQQERGKQNRLATSITDQMYHEAQELLRLFGVPFVVSPMEAEAQCAYMDLTNQSQGSITDDSDVWLFGGTRVYKNFFNQNKQVEYFQNSSIQSQLGLSRENMISIALLCGSDYTLGIQKVGPVSALEIMGEFPGEGVDGLVKFKLWWDEAQKRQDKDTKLRNKLRQLCVHEGFPSPAVVDAYLNPTVDPSEDKFSWSRPDLDLLRDFAREKFGWKKEKVDETLLPVMKRMNDKQSQGRIDRYFQTEAFLEAKKVPSSRVKQALSKLSAPSTELSKSEATEAQIQRAKETMISRKVKGQEVKADSRSKGKGKGKGKSKGTGGAGKSQGRPFKILSKEVVGLSESSSSSDETTSACKTKVKSSSDKAVPSSSGGDQSKRKKTSRTVPGDFVLLDSEDTCETVGSKLKSHLDQLESGFLGTNIGARQKSTGKRTTSAGRGVKGTAIIRTATSRTSKTKARSKISRINISDSSSSDSDY